MTPLQEQEQYARVVGPELDASLSSLAQSLGLSDRDIEHARQLSTVLLEAMRRWIDERLVRVGGKADDLPDVVYAAVQMTANGMRIALRDAEKSVVAATN